MGIDRRSPPISTPSKNVGPGWIIDLFNADVGNQALGSRVAPTNQTQLLNEAIPALSLPAGSNSTARFGATRNYNMPELFGDPARWPTARGLDAASGTPIWHHSDMREIAYYYISGLFDQLKSISN